MKILKSESIFQETIEAKESELRMLKETYKHEQELRSQIDFEKLHECLGKLKLGVYKQEYFHLKADEKGLYGHFQTSLVPLEGCPIKQLSWKGYTTRGVSVNHKRCLEKAKNLKEKIEAMTNLKVNVNYYSFEKDRRNDEKEFTISCTFYIY